MFSTSAEKRGFCLNAVERASLSLRFTMDQPANSSSPDSTSPQFHFLGRHPQPGCNEQTPAASERQRGARSIQTHRPPGSSHCASLTRPRRGGTKIADRHLFSLTLSYSEGPSAATHDSRVHYLEASRRRRARSLAPR